MNVRTYRAHTISQKMMAREARWGDATPRAGRPPPMRPVEVFVDDGVVLPPRPKTRGECCDGPRPCPFVSCKFHLYLDVTEVGSIKFNFPEIDDLSQMAETCALDVADRGGVTLEEVGSFMSFTRERTRQIEDEAVTKLRDGGHEL
jgi:hypothetical protein